ncbi:methyl-accepting chemotaxis protein [Roseibium sp. HPY-6]|uniref:HAMP domain-containing methyl-accepting chemotaxis protein n=1 Tax=Roseibium sp. HPY-6 TaxID=3229852 RepID=UPI00338E780A
MTIQNKILSGVVLMAVLAIVSGGVGLWQVKKIEGQINEISDVVTPTIETADDVVYYATEMQKLILEILADEEPEDVAELHKEYQQAVGNFELAVEELDGIIVDEELQNTIDSLIDEKLALFAAADAMYVSHGDELKFEALAESQQAEMDELGDRIADRLLKLSESNEQEMAAAEEQGDTLVASGEATAEGLNQILGDLFEREYPMVEAALKLRSLVNAIEASVGEVMAEENPDRIDEQRAAFAAVAGEADQWLAALAEYSETDADRADIADLTGDFANWVAMATAPDGVFDTHFKMLTNEGIADLKAEEVDQVGDELVAQINQVIDVADALADGADEKAAVLVNTATMILLGLGVVSLATAGILTVIVMRTAIRPLKDLTEVMSKLAQGELDLSVPSQGRPDEVGRIADTVEVFRQSGVERIRLEKEASEANQVQSERQERVDQLITKFREKMSSLLSMITHDSGDMKSAALTLNQIAETTETTTQGASASSSEATANVETVAGTTEELTASVQEISGQVARGLSLANSASKDADSVNVKVKSLAEAAQQIGQVIGMISDIAEQTNLLALNATIEAARAGEAGKGFAVVASEVKSLAEQTGKATEQISQQITTIQASTEEAVVDIGGIATSVSEIDAFMTSIAAAIEEQSAATQDIARNVQQAAEGNKAVSSGMEQVSSAVTETKSSADSVLSSSENLAERSSEISEEVDTFLQAVEAA